MRIAQYIKWVHRCSTDMWVHSTHHKAIYDVCAEHKVQTCVRVAQHVYVGASGTPHIIDLMRVRIAQRRNVCADGTTRICGCIGHATYYRFDACANSTTQKRVCG